MKMVDAPATAGNSSITAVLAAVTNNSTTVWVIILSTIVFVLLRKNKNNHRRDRDASSKEPIVSELNIYPIKSCGPMKVGAAVFTDIGFAYDRFAQVSDADGKYLTPRDKANAKLFHILPSIVYEQQQHPQQDAGKDDNISTSTSNTGINIHLELRTKVSYAKFRIANLNDTIESKVLSTTKECTPMTGPNVTLQDLGDDVAEWLSTVTGIDGCRLTAIGPNYQRFVEKNPDQNEPVPSFSMGDEEKEVDDGNPIKIIEEKEQQPPPVVSLADEAPFLLTTTSSLDDLNERMQARRGGKKPTIKISMERFRPNIVITGTRPWEEDTWKRIRINGNDFHVWQRCGRCTMTTIDPYSLERGANGGEPLATLSTFRERSNGQRNFGMHLIPVPSSASAASASSSVLHIGNKLEVLEYDPERLQEWKRLFTSE